MFVLQQERVHRGRSGRLESRSDVFPREREQAPLGGPLKPQWAGAVRVAPLVIR